MSQLNLKPSHAAVKNYYTALNQFGQLYIDHEMAVRSAFQYLLSTSGRKLKLTLVPEFEIKRKNSSIRVDGALLDEFHLSHGYRSPPPPPSIIVIPNEVRDLQFCRGRRNCRSLAPLGMTNLRRRGMTKLRGRMTRLRGRMTKLGGRRMATFLGRW